MQQGSQRFTFGLVELRLYHFWPGRFLFETIQALLLKSMDRIAHGLGGTAQVEGNFRWALFSTGGKPDLTSAQSKSIR
jgi:hypothetical protein